MISSIPPIPHPINVCLVAEYYYPVLSGAGERFRRYAPGLLRRGINLSVITLSRTAEIQEEVLEGISVLRLPLDIQIGQRDGKKSAAAPLLLKVKEHFTKNNYRPDVIHVLSHTIEGAGTVWRMRWQGIPCVNSITMMPREGQTPVKRFRLLLHQWIRYSPFNIIVTSSEAMACRMRRQGVSSGRIKTIPNGADLNRFRPVICLDERTDLRQKLGLDANAEIILYLGHVEPRKGTDLLAGAWPEIASKRPKAYLVLVGSAEMERVYRNLPDAQDLPYLKKIDKMIKGTGAAGRVLVIGQVENVESYLRAADVFVFPSQQEGSPNVVIEAMATGLACVLAPFEGLSEELGSPGQEFILTEYSPESISTAIIELLSNNSLRDSLGSAARNFAVEHFDVDKSLDLYAQMYFDLTDRVGRNSPPVGSVKN